MKVTPDLVNWQRRLYGSNHRDPVNLIIHLVTVPVFIAGLILAFVGQPLASILAIASAIALQGFGHTREKNAPEPFLSPLDFVARFTVENTVTFWRFLFSGEYLRNFRGR